MAKKKIPSEPAALTTYTARAKDLKILGHVEAASDKEALQKARKQYGAASVERRETAAGNDALSTPEAPAAGAFRRLLIFRCRAPLSRATQKNPQKIHGKRGIIWAHARPFTAVFVYS